jgi:hypothetical protein
VDQLTARAVAVARAILHCSALRPNGMFDAGSFEFSSPIVLIDDVGDDNDVSLDNLDDELIGHSQHEARFSRT